MVRYRFFAIGVLLLCVCGCGDEVVSPGQVLEIVSASGSVVSVPPEAVWDGIRLNQREDGFEAEQRAFYTKYIDAEASQFCRMRRWRTGI